MIVEVINQIKALLPSAIFLSDEKIEQAGQYLTFNRFSKLSSKESLFEFKLYVAGYTLNKNTEGVLVLCDEFIKVLHNNRANALVFPTSLILVDDARLITHNEGLYIYAISFSVRLRI